MGVASTGERDILDNMKISLPDDLRDSGFGNGMKVMKNGFSNQRHRILEVEQTFKRTLLKDQKCDANAALASLVSSLERTAIIDERNELISQHTPGFAAVPPPTGNDTFSVPTGNDADKPLPVRQPRQRKLLLIGDSMIKYIDANRLMHTRKNDKLCVPGATIETIENELVKNYKHQNNDVYTDVLVHVGTNNIPHDHPNIVINSLARLMHTVQKIFPRAELYFSGIIPKYSNAYIMITDKINYALRNWCRVNGYHFVDTRGLFVNSKYRIRFDRLSKNDRLHLNRAGVQALAKYFTFYLNTLYGKLTSPPS